MKKLVLKKDIVARINGGEMNQLRGGCGPYGPCDQYTFDHPTTCGHTCTGDADPSCPGYASCVESCWGTCDQFCRSIPPETCLRTVSKVGCYAG